VCKRSGSDQHRRAHDRSGHGEVFIAGGVESMSRAPFAFLKSEEGFDRTPPQVFDTTIGWRFTNPKLAAMHYPYSMGETAENVARKYKISREEQDRFALWSQQKWGRGEGTLSVPERDPSGRGCPGKEGRSHHGLRH
jgi:acetyl-CoA acetyltransferase